MKITFKKPEEILDFVNKVEKYDCACIVDNQKNSIR